MIRPKKNFAVDVSEKATEIDLVAINTVYICFAQFTNKTYGDFFLPYFGPL